MSLLCSSAPGFLRASLLTLAALLVASTGHAASMLGQPVDPSVVITFGDYEWVWASPCDGGCSDIVIVAANADWVFPSTIPALALSDPNVQGEALAHPLWPAPADFGTAASFKCASAWFDLTWDHCDYLDAEHGSIADRLNGSHWELWLVRPIPEPGTALLVGLGLPLLARSTPARRRRQRAASFPARS